MTDERGTPLLDLAHVVSCLNKLDVGSSERICLMSRDEQNVIIVSFADLKRSFELAFQQLMEASLQLPVCYRSDDYRGGGGSGGGGSWQRRSGELANADGSFDASAGKTAIRGRGEGGSGGGGSGSGGDDGGDSA